MPTPLAAADILRVTIACRVPAKAQLGLNVIYYRVTTPGGMNLEQVPLAFYNRIVTQYTSWMPSVAQFSGVSVSRTSAPLAGPFYSVFNQSGTGGSDVLPMQVTALIRSSANGDAALDPPLKPCKGRVYIPFASATNWTGATGTWTTTGMSKLESIRAVLGPTLTLTGGASLEMVLRRTKTNPPPAPPTFRGYTTVTQLLSLRAAATQRRRGDFGRVNAAFGGVL